MILAKVRGLVMKDSIVHKEFEGNKTSYRQILLFQPETDSKELLEIKDVNDGFKVELNKYAEIPVTLNPWRNNKGQSGLSVKHFFEV